MLTQYKSHSLDRHITPTWRMSPLLGNYITPVPAQMRRGPHWFVGSADAIFQNLNLIYDEDRTSSSCSAPTTSTAWIPGRWSSSTSTSGAGVTVAGIRVPIGDASQFGVIETAADGARITAFREKPTDPMASPTRPTRCSPPWGTTCSAPRPSSRR